VIEDKLYLKEKISLNNRALFKGKDLGLLREVMNYLESNNLSAKLLGIVVNNFNKGNIRHYSNINIAVKNYEIKQSFDSFDKYIAKVLIDLYKISANKKKIKNWFVEDLTGEYFKIKNFKTNTEIYLSF